MEWPHWKVLSEMPGMVKTMYFFPDNPNEPFLVKKKGFKGFAFVVSVMLQPRKACHTIPSERNILIESFVKGGLNKKNSLLSIFVCPLFFFFWEKRPLKPGINTLGKRNMVTKLNFMWCQFSKSVNKTKMGFFWSPVLRPEIVTICYNNFLECCAWISPKWMLRCCNCCLPPWCHSLGDANETWGGCWKLTATLATSNPFNSYYLKQWGAQTMHPTNVSCS